MTDKICWLIAIFFLLEFLVSFFAVDIIHYLHIGCYIMKGVTCD